MAAAVAYVGSVANDDGVVRLSGVAVGQPDSAGVPFSFTFAWGSTAIQINAAIKAAVRSALADEGYTVGLLDSVVLLASAVAL